MRASDAGRDERQPFPVEITAKASSGGRWEYSWKEKVDATGGYVDADPGRTGDAAVNTLYEVDNNEVDVGTVVRAYVRSGQDAGSQCYEFTAPSGSTPGSAGLTLKEQDGTPSYASTLVVEFHQADGLTLTQPSANTVLVRIAAATATQAGIVSTAAQTLGGVKTFNAAVALAGGATFPADASFAIAATKTLEVVGPGKFKLSVPMIQPPFSFAIANGANNNLDVSSAARSMLRLTGPSAAWSLTGVGTPAPVDGDYYYFLNATGQTGTIKNEDAGSTAAFRIVCPGGTDQAIPDGGSFAIAYDGTSSRWRLAGSGATGTGTQYYIARWATGSVLDAASGLKAGPVVGLVEADCGLDVRDFVSVRHGSAGGGLGAPGWAMYSDASNRWVVGGGGSGLQLTSAGVFTVHGTGAVVELPGASAYFSCRGLGGATVVEAGLTFTGGLRTSGTMAVALSNQAAALKAYNAARSLMGV